MTSRPTRARGLKRDGDEYYAMQHSSRPTRARGLKHGRQGRAVKSREVAPHAGAWIETSSAAVSAETNASRAPRGRVD